MKDVAIIGSGVTGLAAGLYCARYEIASVIIGEHLGGATAKAWTVENYPGFETIDGYDLVIKMRDQVAKLNVPIVDDRITDISAINGGFLLKGEAGQDIEAKTVIFAQGAERRKLGLANEDKFAKGNGIHYCTTCDGPLYKNKTIIVVGGGDAAVKGMILASQFVAKIYCVNLGSELTGEPTNLTRVKQYIESGKIEVINNTQVTELVGTDRITGAKLANGRELTADGLFVEIGATPDVELATKLGVTLDDHGYLAVNTMMETNIAGVFAAGDAVNTFGHFKQVVTGVALGSVAATSAFSYLSKKVVS